MRLIQWTLALLFAAVALVSHANAQPSAADTSLIGWWDAGVGITSDANGVATWADQSSYGNDATRNLGTMSAASTVFPAGNRPVVRFTKDGFFNIDNADGDFNSGELTVFLVLDAKDGTSRNHYFANYTSPINWGAGYALAIDQLSPTQTILRNFSSNSHGPTEFNSSPPPASVVDPNDAYSDSATGPGASDPLVGPTSITNTLSASGFIKENFVRGASVGTVPLAMPATLPAIDFDPNPTHVVGCPGCGGENANGVSIGGLGQVVNGHFFMDGDIAELIVYNSVDAQQRANIEQYITNKYFVPEPTSAALLLLGGLGCLLRRKRR